MTFTVQVLQECFPLAPGSLVATYFPFLANACTQGDISNNHRLGAFLANVGIESSQLRITRENTNYSWQALRKIFPSHFATDQIAQGYDRQPQKIAERIYCDRMGNGPEGSGDASRYIGRGLIQLTGKTNYEACGQALGVDLLGSPDLLAQPLDASLSAAWFWASRDLNDVADQDFKTVCIRINGGLNGFPQREALYERILSFLN